MGDVCTDALVPRMRDGDNSPTNEEPSSWPHAELIDDTTYMINHAWKVNGICVPTRVHDDVECFIVKPSWGSNLAWITIAGQKQRLLQTAGDDKPNYTYRNLGACTFVTDALAAIPRGKPIRRMRRVGVSGQPCEPWAEVHVGGDDGATITIANDRKHLIVEATFVHLKLLMTCIHRELVKTTMLDSVDSGVCNDRQPSHADSSSTLVDTPSKEQPCGYETPESDDDTQLDINAVVDRPSLPKHIIYAQSRQSFIVRRPIGPSKWDKKEFKIRGKAPSTVREVSWQRTRALEFNASGAVLDNAPFAKRCRKSPSRDESDA